MVDNHAQSLRVSNGYSEPITLSLEPWADEILIPSKAGFDIVAVGPDGGHLEVTYEERRVSVYGWSGSTLSVFHGRQRLLECDIRFRLRLAEFLSNFVSSRLVG